MLSRYKLKYSDNILTLNGLEVDKACRETMNQLGERMFRSVGKTLNDEKKARAKDRDIAIKKWGKKHNLDDYAIHHTYSGLVGLIPRDLHQSVRHNGYFYRLKYEIEPEV